MPLSLLTNVPRCVQAVLEAFNQETAPEEDKCPSFSALLQLCIENYSFIFPASIYIAKMVVQNEHCPRHLTRRIKSQLYNKTTILEVYKAMLQLVETSIEGRKHSQ